ncbi:uncharacterized protein N7469_007118 [Penicillium citrinum]|uniref:Ams2/SPT21 N-terminal domain-containing protein n=1 Tax=Penicillium citrinum TaxID=5077 RepID=A0A9W9NVW1_PENCI|nr:uncharacterized protein N7469_007118 [Penicillium citrinum]KAJ5227112.1 hypothetical protein N7469_007118 [Penicillium citrinum]
MESQDGITVRPMRLKVLYTFDNDNKTNCLARWPHVLDVQTAYLDEQTPVGVIELKTCIQAIVSASPELVAQLGKDYTVYAYDYSEYETPLVGQGMLSWVLASASPTPEAPAHQSKTMVTGRVCKNPLGLFTKSSAQETLEVKLRLVPVPTVMQSEYLDSMQKYRELSSVIPHDFDAQSWTNFMRQNPSLLERSRSQHSEAASSPMHHSGIERFHQLLSEGTTQREFSNYHSNESIRSASPTHSYAPSRVSTPGGTRSSTQQQQSQSKGFTSNDMIRPSSSASMRDNDFQAPQLSPKKRIHSVWLWQWRRIYRPPAPQPSSLRVQASTAASVRIHRPTPVNPLLTSEHSNEEPVRPPTPISRPGDNQRRIRLSSSLLREYSAPSTYTSPYAHSDDLIPTDQTATSPDDSRYQGLFEPSFNMPSSPPVVESRFPPKSSPNLPPISLDTDSGFMTTTPVDEGQRPDSNPIGTVRACSVRSAVQATSPASTADITPQNANAVSSQPPKKQNSRPPPARTQSCASSRPSSRAGAQYTPKQLAPAPISQSELEQMLATIPASDPIGPTHPPLVHSQTWAGPMSDCYAQTPGASAPPPTSRRNRKGDSSKQAKRIQTRLETAIRDGQMPPYCENCGSIETPTWRRAWSKEFNGNEQVAQSMMADDNHLLWEVLDKDASNQVTKFKIYKKSVLEEDVDFVQVLLCNPCGLWLFKAKTMRPENKWNKQPAERIGEKRKRPSRKRKQSGGPLSKPSTRTRSKNGVSEVAASSPAPTEASSVQNDEGNTPQLENINEDGQTETEDCDGSATKRRRATSAEPPRSTDLAKDRWEGQDAVEALKLAIQSSPARNIESRKISSADENKLTPKPVRRALFPTSQNEGPLRELDASFVNSCSPRRSPRIASSSRDGKQHQEKENQGPNDEDDLGGLFESPPMDFDLPVSPTPRRRNARVNVMQERRHSLPSNSPTASRKREAGAAANAARLTAERLQRAQNGQGSTRSTPRQGRSPNKNASVALAEGALHPETFNSLDGMMLDIFDNANHPPIDLDEVKFSGDDWADWLPSDYVSPTGSEDGPAPSEDLINALLSEPAGMKQNLHAAEFNIFNFEATDIPDSGFFSSDAAHGDSAGLPSKAQSAEEHPSEQATL